MIVDESTAETPLLGQFTCFVDSFKDRLIVTNKEVFRFGTIFSLYRKV